MSQLTLDHESKANLKKVPNIKPGQTVKVYQKIKEGEKERVQIFEGLIIKISSGTGLSKTFTVRKVVDGVGVEKVFPLYTPTIDKIQIIKEGQVRRAKLYYMRDLSGKSTRLKELMMEEEASVEPVAEPVIDKNEPVAASTEPTVATVAHPAAEPVVEESVAEPVVDAAPEQDTEVPK